MYARNVGSEQYFIIRPIYWDEQQDICSFNTLGHFLNRTHQCKVMPQPYSYTVNI